MTAQEGFWNDKMKAQEILQEITKHKYWVDEIEKCEKELDEQDGIFSMASEEGEESLYDEIESGLKAVEDVLVNLELKKMLGDVDDTKDAIVTIHPGAGGTESQDWAEMLMRMYLRWMEKRGFSYTLMDVQSGDEAGIKSATIEVKGDFAYGYIKAESGVHRLVRISPFDANRRRHTSFASVFVFPQIDDNIEIDINPSDLKIDT
ncbi:PCRF domain-containing protein, partial [bacterium]|nr:PCRF domain-containing protein [bacterium]